MSLRVLTSSTCSYLISLFLHKHKSACFRKPSNQLWRHNMAFMLTQHRGELKVCDSLRNRCEEHYKSKESNLYSKSWPLHDPKTISRKHPFNSQWFCWETAYLPICLFAFWTEYYERETAPRPTVLFCTMCFIFIILCNIFSNMNYWSLSLDASLAVYRGRRLWHTLWGEITYSVLCLRKLRDKKVSDLKDLEILFLQCRVCWL